MIRKDRVRLDDLISGCPMLAKGERGEAAVPAKRQLKLRPGNHAFGATALVYFDDEAGRAIKVFLSGKDPEWVRRRFDSELAAYEIVQSHPELMKLTPIFYGQCHIASVLDEADADVSSQYLLGFAYEMELLRGQFTKIGGCFGAPNRSQVEKLFWEADILGMEDADVLRDAEGTIIKVIDIGEKPFESPPHDD